MAKARIDVYYEHIAFAQYHKYIVYTDAQNKQWFARGDSESGRLVAQWGEYVPGNGDYGQGIDPEPISTASAATAWTSIKQSVAAITAANLDYDLNGPNSNTVVDSVLALAKLSVPRNPNGHSAPGSGPYLGNDSANTLNGNDNANEIHGLGGSDSINGKGGADEIFGEGGNDKLDGGAGKDLLDGGLGKDSMTGGDDNDTYYVDDAGDSVTEKSGSGAGTDKVLSSVSWTLSKYVEELELTGSSSIRATGNSDSNVLVGNAGTNVLFGGGGSDRLRGGSGGDTFVFQSLKDSVTGSSRDVIEDFTVSQGDKIDLTTIDAISGTKTNEPFSFIGTSLFTKAGQLRVFNGVVSGDTNGDKKADFEISIGVVGALAAGDFLL